MIRTEEALSIYDNKYFDIYTKWIATSYEDKLILALDILTGINYKYDCYSRYDWDKTSVSVYYDGLLGKFCYERNNINTEGRFAKIPRCRRKNKSSEFNLKELLFNITHKETSVYCFTIVFLHHNATFTESGTDVLINDDFTSTLIDEIERELSELTTVNLFNEIKDSDIHPETTKEKIDNYYSSKWAYQPFLHREPLFEGDFGFYIATSNLSADMSYVKALYKFIEIFSIVSSCQELDYKRKNELFDIIILQLKYIYSTTDVLSIIYKVAVKAKTHKYKISMKRLFRLNNKERNIIKYLYYSGIIDVPFYVRLRYTLKTKNRFKK